MAETITIRGNLPARKDFDVYRGDDFDFAFTFDVPGLNDLVGHDFNMKIINPTTGAEYVTLSVSSGITVSGLTVTASLTSAQAKAMAENKYKYDLQWTKDTGKIKTLFVGLLNPSGDITPET